MVRTGDDRQRQENAADMAPTAQILEDLTAPETPEQVRERQLAAFYAAREANGAAVESERARREAEDEEDTPLHHTRRGRRFFG